MQLVSESPTAPPSLTDPFVDRQGQASFDIFNVWCRRKSAPLYCGQDDVDLRNEGGCETSGKIPIMPPLGVIRRYR
ncbi:unnamed protein product [Parascedosporium putredinis]|uniref:Uncharacterized protein n=1 Tax=Parascedosporium putredinis TaxID=1442378 RepID=A0A9P1H1Y8_9PEZI|nr:unnamed protein product [Parascedosporium putredinis]CAI7995606.1 unnamed protein product [Parascedosporium putredinis]